MTDSVVDDTPLLPDFKSLVALQDSRDLQHCSAVTEAIDGRSFNIYLGYRRWLEFDDCSQPGQDFAIVRATESHVVGMVADGVSQSFHGEVAAERLSHRLIDWLWSNRDSPPDHLALLRVSSRIQSEVADELQSLLLPTGLSRIQQHAFENIRKKGSQAVFAAFVWHAAKSQISLYQVGNVDAIIHYGDGSHHFMAGASRGRWSTDTGRDPPVTVTRLTAPIEAIVLKSDGLKKDWGVNYRQDIEASTFGSTAAAFAHEDDVSFVAAVQDPSRSTFPAHRLDRVLSVDPIASGNGSGPLADALAPDRQAPPDSQTISCVAQSTVGGRGKPLALPRPPRTMSRLSVLVHWLAIASLLSILALTTLVLLLGILVSGVAAMCAIALGRLLLS